MPGGMLHTALAAPHRATCFTLHDFSMIFGMTPRSAPHRESCVTFTRHHDDLHNKDIVHLVRALQLRGLHSFLHSEPPGKCRCTQRACNNIVQARIRRAATVGSELSSRRLHPKICWTCTTDTSNTLSMNCPGESLWSNKSLDREKQQLRHDKDDDLHDLCNRDTVHHVKQFGNLCGPTKSLHHEKPPLRLNDLYDLQTGATGES